MIKVSFLRNYSLSKIYDQAEDQKNKLRVFCQRKVAQIIRDRQEKQRAAQRRRLTQTYQEEKAQKGCKNHDKSQFSKENVSRTHGEADRRKNSQDKKKEKNKTDLSLIDLHFKINPQNNFSLLQNQKLRNLKIKCNNLAFYQTNSQERPDLLRKNTVRRFFTSTEPQYAPGKSQIAFRMQQTQHKYAQPAPKTTCRAKTKLMKLLNQSITIGKTMPNEAQPTY